MKPRMTRLLPMMLTMLFSVSTRAQDCQPAGKFTDANGETNTMAAGETYAGSAPLTVAFSANPPSENDPATNYEWHFLVRIILGQLISSAMMRIRNIPSQRPERHVSFSMKSWPVTLHATTPSMFPSVKAACRCRMPFHPMATASTTCTVSSRAIKALSNSRPSSSTVGGRSSMNGMIRPVDGTESTRAGM